MDEVRPAYHPEPRWDELGIFSDGKGEWQNLYDSDNYLNLFLGESASVTIEDLPPSATLPMEGWNAQ